MALVRWLAAGALALGCAGEDDGAGRAELDGTGGAPPNVSAGGAAGAAADAGSGSGGSDAGGAAGNAGGGVARLPPDRCPDPAESPTAEGLRATVDGALALSAAELAARHPVTYSGALGYSPGASAGLDIIQGSGHALDAGELAKLEQNGFVLSERQRFPTFFYGYRSLYAADLPLYVTVDSVLHAVHRSYDSILEALEWAVLLDDVRSLLSGLHDNLARDVSLPAEVRADVDLYLAVARSLLDDPPAAPVAGASPADVDAIVTKVRAAAGLDSLVLFGSSRQEDLSQFVPRGHYVDGLSRYFHAMMWLGRIDLRMIEADGGGQTPNRRQIAAALAIGQLLEPTLRATWERLDRVIGAFVGEPDSMTPLQVGELRESLGISQISDLATLDDATLRDRLLASPHGMQRIASHIAYGGAGGTAPLARSFTLLGQRYTVDSHVFSNVVYDRVKAGAVRRMMPSPLDAAFAALGNDQALTLLAPELAAYDYAGDLGAMRTLVDEHRCGYFESNLYTLWLGALRALSPRAQPEGLPTIARTEAWGRRLLSTQMASWAELRHDTLLYAKQSYTGIPVCEFPDAYVDPYPAAFDRIAALALHGRDLLASIRRDDAVADLLAGIDGYFSHLYDTALLLKEIAQHELTGTPLTAEHLAFVNDAVTLKRERVGCASMNVPSGWYPALFFDPYESDQYDPTIADVHTQPADASGAIVGRVLHVATGMPRFFVATIDTCTGPRAYAGVASTYLERITEGFDRLTDERWATELNAATPPDPSWLADLVAR